MRRLVVALGSVALVLAVAVPAGGAVADKKSVKKFCKQALSAPDPSTGDARGAETIEREFKKLAKLAPTKKVKRAAKAIAKFYDEVADGASVTDTTTEEGIEYAEGLAVYSSYVTTKCITALDDLPGVDNIPGLDDLENLPR